MEPASRLGSAPPESLAALLRVDPVEPAGGGTSPAPAAFAARLEDFFGTALEGDLLARLALAAGATAPGQELRALHAVFVAPATPEAPLRIEVERVGEDGIAPRRALRARGDTLVCHASARFGARGTGAPDHDARPPSDLPDPESLASTLSTARAEGWPEHYARGPLEYRRVGPLVPDRAAGEPCAHVAWLRPRAPLPDDPALRAAALAFVAGFYVHWGFERRLGPAFDYARFASLDHALWVHEAPAFDDWWLLVATSQLAGGGHALGERRIFARDGRLLAASAHGASLAGG